MRCGSLDIKISQLWGEVKDQVYVHLYCTGIWGVNPPTMGLQAGLNFVLKSLVVCHSNAQPTGTFVSHDTWLIQANRQAA
jgi:hypothetical protein